MRICVLLLLGIFTLIASSCESPVEYSPADKVKNLLITNYAELQSEVEKLETISKDSTALQAMRESFVNARLKYKKIEALVAFYYPDYSLRLNGAAIDKNDYHDSNRKIEPATGFQVLEENLFSENPEPAELQKEIAIIHGYLQAFEREIQSINLSDANIWEAIRLQNLRNLSLGLSGFDSPINLNSIAEAKASYEGIKEIISPYGVENVELTELDKAINYLLNYKGDFNAFDRAEFIRDYANPLAVSLNEMQKDLGISNGSLSSPMNMEEGVFYAVSNFNPDFFAPPGNKKPNPEMITLGKTLFFDPILSGNGEVSCATCHQPQLAFSENKALAVEGVGSQARNTPTLLFSSLQNSQFADRRVSYLEDQARSVIDNKREMHGSFDAALERLNQSESYKKSFEEVFESEKIDDVQLMNSLGAYVRSLTPGNSRFDDFLMNKVNLAPDEIKGFNLFMGKGKCGTCHFYPLFNGSVPPLYTETESEVLGVPEEKIWEEASVDNDLGEFEIVGADLKKYAFKTPTIRNAASTWPYMHNGVYESLEEVLEFYNVGGGAGIGISLPNQTLPPDSLHLSDQEMDQIIAFIRSLSNE